MRRFTNPRGRKVRSKAQWRLFGALLSRGKITKKDFDDLTRDVKYSRLPEKLLHRGRKMRRRRKYSRRGAIRRRNEPPFALTRTGARTKKSYYKALAKRLARKRKFGYTMMLRRKGFGKYKGLPKYKRHIGRPKGSVKKHTARRSSKRRMSAAHKRKLIAGLRRWQRKHHSIGKIRRKSHPRSRSRRAAAKRYRAGRRKHRPSRKAIRAMQRGLRRYLRKKRSARAARIRALRKARRVRGRKLYGRRPLIRRVARRVKRVRPGVRIRAIRRMISRDLRHKAHRRGRGRSVRTLTRDAIFGIDYRRAVKGQHIRPKNMRHGRFLRAMGRHPSHLRRRIPRRLRRGWKEFAGTRPNLVASYRGSPVHGSFNGVLIQKLTLQGGTITPPSGKELWFVWSNGGRTFEIVGGPAAITSLAKSMAHAGRPMKLNRLDYAAPRYPVPVGARRTSRSRMSVLFYHHFTHQCFLSWNGKFGSAARFPIIVRGARGASMVNRSGIVL